MLRNTLSKFAAVLALFAIMTPSLALAHDTENDNQNTDNQSRFEQIKDSFRAQATNEFGVHVLGPKDEKNKHQDRRDFFVSNFFYNGEVTAISATGFTVKTNSDVSFNVNTESAKIIRIPRSVIDLSDVVVGDTVHVTGTKVSGTITASVVYVMSQNLKPAITKGTVTAVTDSSITVQTKDNKTVTVNTDGDTQVIAQDGQPATLADIDAGSKVKMFGLWDTVLHVFNAIKIKLF
ncbi:MAG TPA: DUF5666 domain-containing protein [Patescibacteria group bacterium]|jgi:hypothetical protein|nr:DUF5666 domain-containing protein [Patescibacteria group bacterium]